MREEFDPAILKSIENTLHAILMYEIGGKRTSRRRGSELEAIKDIRHCRDIYRIQSLSMRDDFREPTVDEFATTTSHRIVAIFGRRHWGVKKWGNSEGTSWNRYYTHTFDRCECPEKSQIAIRLACESDCRR